MYRVSQRYKQDYSNPLWSTAYAVMMLMFLKTAFYCLWHRTNSNPNSKYTHTRETILWHELVKHHIIGPLGPAREKKLEISLFLMEIDLSNLLKQRQGQLCCVKNGNFWRWGHIQRLCWAEPKWATSVCNMFQVIKRDPRRVSVAGWCLLGWSADLLLMFCTLGNGKFPY